MLTIKRFALILIFYFTLGGCSEPARTASTIVETNDIAISATTVVDIQSNKTTIELRLFNTKDKSGIFPDTGRPIIVSGADSLTASTFEETVNFRRFDSSATYTAIVNTAAAGTAISIELNRTSGFRDALNTQINIPALFEFTSPSQLEQVQLESTIEINWDFRDTDGNSGDASSPIIGFSLLSICPPDIERGVIPYTFPRNTETNPPIFIPLTQLTNIDRTAISNNILNSQETCSLAFSAVDSTDYTFSYDIDPEFANNIVENSTNYPFRLTANLVRREIILQ